MNGPITRTEAEKTKYGQHFHPLSFNQDRCAEGVYDSLARTRHQCARKPGHGPDGLYCKQHAAEYLTESKTWWHLNYNRVPEPVEIVDSTNAFVVLKGGRRESRDRYFESFEAAKKKAISMAEASISHLLSDLERARAQLDRAKALNPPNV